MLERNKIAVLFTSIGLVGLAISGFVAQPTAHAAHIAAKPVSVAVSFGSHLRLLRTSEARPTAQPLTARNLICTDVYRLSLADVGITCSRTAATRSVALVK